MDLYEVLKTLHIVSMIAWMAGMLYLPRLFVYHAESPVGSPQSETFKVMERRLLKGIVNPAMILTWSFGLWLMVEIQAWEFGWFHVKFLAVLALSALHGALARWQKDFARDANRHSARFYRLANETPFLLAIAIVAMVVIKPF